MNEKFIPPYRLGVDIGGTFTDVVIADAAGLVLAYKSPTTRDDPAKGVLSALAGAAATLSLDTAGLLSQCERFVHGSTIATNTLLERKGVRVGLLVTEGFRDTLEIRRGTRAEVWDHRAPSPIPLVPRRLRKGVVERIDRTGAIITALDLRSLQEALDVFRREEVEAIAICFLHSFQNNSHERESKAFIEKEWPGIWVSCSSDIAPVLGEYERSSTVAINAYVGPKVAPYLRKLEQTLASFGLARSLMVVQSNGGAMSVSEVEQQPVQMVLSGPAAGVGAIQAYAFDTGAANLVSIEVGGTSCDVTLMCDGAVQMTDQLDIDGHCIAIPSVEIHTIGNGGGTIGRVDAAGMLHAGPQGAGARPGPAAYGFGGTLPTVTDAQLLLGRLAPGPYAGGAITLDRAKAEEAIGVHLAKPLGISAEQAAAGLLRLVEQNIQHAVERVSIERGFDIRDFTLIAAGGAGPLHGTAVGRALGCAAIYVPRLAGVFCAFGMCNTEVRVDRLRSWYLSLDQARDIEMDRAFHALESNALDTLGRQGFAKSAVVIDRSVALRYPGQQWPIQVNCAVKASSSSIRNDFEAAHQRLYGHFQIGAAIEASSLKVSARGRSTTTATEIASRSSAARPMPLTSRPVWINDSVGTMLTPVFDGQLLEAGHAINGPAIVNEATTTILVEPRQKLTLTRAGNYLITNHCREA